MAEAEGPSAAAATDRPVFRPDLRAAALRAAAALRPLRPYEILESLPGDIDPMFQRKCDRILMDGWTAGRTTVELEPPFPWTGLDRSAAFDIHSWKPLTKLLTAYSLYGKKRYLAASRVMIRDWVQRFHPDPGTVATYADLDALVGQGDDPVWYDMSVGLRVYRLAYLLDVLARDEAVTDAEIERLAAAMYLHHEALTNERFFKGHNNHGLYQALGQLAAARRFPGLPRMDRYARLAAERLDRMLHEHFFDSGVHREHSPGYHYMLLGTLVSARSSGVLGEGRFDDLLEGAEEALAWMIQPDGVLAPIGDTDPTPMERPARLAEQYLDPHLRWLMTGGETGEAPRAGVRAYPDAGYVFARLRGPDGNWSYLAQHAGFHSRTHKQADHLAFLWHDLGRDVLADPGRYAFKGKTAPNTPLHEDGFWYADPKRVYVESTRAHNAVSIDGRNHARAGVKPFGSAVVGASEQDGLAVSETYVVHPPGVRQRRLLVLSPGECLLVLDWLSDKDGGEHVYRQHFSLAPLWTPVDGAPLAFVAPDGLQLRAVDLLGARAGPVVRGQSEPELNGWVSDGPERLVPATCLSFEADGAQRVFATVFAFAERLEADGAPRVSETLTSARLGWSTERARYALDLRRGSGQPTIVTLRKDPA